jgi:Icc-related predicted phosphoesterase
LGMSPRQDASKLCHLAKAFPDRTGLERQEGKSMRIVAFSDTEGKHGQLEVPDGDVLVFAGDMSHHGSSVAIEEFDRWLGTLPHPNKLVIAGNHDTLFERNPGIGRLLMKNCRYLQDEVAEVDGVKFWGSPWQPWFFNWSFNLPRGDKLAEKWAMIPEDAEVLITHGPPFGIGDNTGQMQVGCEALRERVMKLPKLKTHIFGHVHESPGLFKQEGILFANVSWQPGRQAAVIDL